MNPLSFIPQKKKTPTDNNKHIDGQLTNINGNNEGRTQKCQKIPTQGNRTERKTLIFVA